MIAEMIAEATDRRLFAVEPRRVVGETIGEAEKNLARAFDAAAAQGEILFFDEAEALFGRETEVEEQTVGSGYLLRMIDESEAVVILATTVRGALDPVLVQATRAVLNVS